MQPGGDLLGKVAVECLDVFLETPDMPGDERQRIERIVLKQRRQVERVGHFILLINGVSVKEGGVGQTAAFDGEVVALAAGDLRVKDTVEGGGEVGVVADREHGLVGVAQPVEAAPDFAAEEFFRAQRLRQRADSAQRGEKNPDVSGVLVGGVVGIDNLGLRGGEEGLQVFAHTGAGSGGLDARAGVGELRDEAVLADDGGGALLLHADGFHLLVTEVGVRACAGAPGPVGAGHRAEPPVRALKARQDAVQGHELQVVLMGTDSQVGGAGKGLRSG